MGPSGRGCGGVDGAIAGVGLVAAQTTPGLWRRRGGCGGAEGAAVRARGGGEGGDGGDGKHHWVTGEHSVNLFVVKVNYSRCKGKTPLGDRATLIHSGGCNGWQGKHH